MNSLEQRRQEWSERIANFRASGMTMSAWAASNGITVDQLKYWLYKSKSTVAVSSTSTTVPPWVPLTVTDLPSESPINQAPLIVRVGQVSIELRSGFDPQLFREVVTALNVSC